MPELSHKQRLAPKPGEQVYKIDEIADMLKVSRETVRRLFRDHPGVLKLGPRGRRQKRDHVSLRVPHSVLVQYLAEAAQ